MFEFAEFVVRGCLLGVTYGLLAYPISLLFIATDTVDLAVGAYAVLAGAVAMIVGGPLGIVAALIVAMIAAAIVGGISLTLGLRRNNDELALVLASFGFAIFLESFILTFYGKDPFIRQPFSTFISLGGIRLSPQAPINAGMGVALVTMLYLLLYRTSWGREMRAAAVNVLGAQLAGIPVRRLQFSTFLLAGLLAGIAGVLVLYTSGMDFAAGLHLTLSGFGAAIVFGLTSPLRGFLGGLALGVVEALSAGYASGALASLLPLIFIFLMLALSRSSLQGTAGGRA